jgi:HSP20 family protein
MSATATEITKPETKAASPKVVEVQTIFEDLKNLVKTIEQRAFDLFNGRGGEPGRELEDWFKAESELLHPVLCEVTDADDHLTVKAEVPGFNAQELKLSVEPDRLFIRGTKETMKKDEKENTVYTERRSNEMFRTLYLPAEVDPEKVTAELKDGMLNMTLPKVKVIKPVNIEVKTN